jgi:hypothetical protein
MINKDFNKLTINLFIIISGLFIFITKWYLSYFYFDEEVESRIIFESISDGYFNFAPFKALANLNLNNSFSPLIYDLGTITIPLGVFVLHFIFYSIIGTYSFIILEFFFIIFFLIIFYRITRLIDLNRIQSLTIAIILLNIPNIFQILNIYNLEYFNIIYAEFYSLRFPRPIVSNILLYLFIFIILKNEKKNFFTKKNSIVLGILSSLLFTSYFHAFFLLQIVLIFYLFYKFRFNLFQILKTKYNYILLYVLTFLLVSSLFFINMFFADADFLQRNGLVVFNLDKKLIILKHLFFKLFKIQFLFLLFLSVFLLFIFNKRINLIGFKKINILFIIFYSSIVTPFIFIFISPSFFSHFYHFTNLVLITAFLLFFYISVLFIHSLIKNFFPVILVNIFSISVMFIFLIGNIHISKNNYELKNLENDRFVQRKEFNSIIDIIKKKNVLKNKNISLLTFDNRFLVWSVLNDIEYLSIVNGVMVSRTNENIENDIINSFKYLNLSKKDFSEFIENKKISSWRYRNDHIRDYFWMRYQANAMITFNDSKNFDHDVLEFIKKSSPLLSQQLIMPNEEVERFLKKYQSENEASFLIPKIIIINKKDYILAKAYISNKAFCKAFDGKIYDFYYSFDLNQEC